MIIRGLLLATISVTSAQAYCYKPDPPSCATRYGAFDDEWEFSRCKREMESYKSDVEIFLSCQRRESDDAISDYNSAVQSFNRRARS